MPLNHQTVGNVGLYYVCYRLSLLGWNVMPTSRNARGVDIVAYNEDASRKLAVQVKALSKRNPVPVGKNIAHLVGDFFVVCRYAQRQPPEFPECFVLPLEEVRQRAERKGKDGKESYWLQIKGYESDGFREKWGMLQ